MALMAAALLAVCGGLAVVLKRGLQLKRDRLTAAALFFGAAALAVVARLSA